MKIGIAGAGIMGRLLALACVNTGHQVSLYDKDARDGNASCSMVAAGILAPVSELIKSDLIIYQLGLESLQYHWAKMIKNIDHDIYFKKMGSLVVAHQKDKSELLNFIAQIDNKYTNHQIYKKLNHDEIIDIEPELSKFNEAYLLQEEGQIDNQALMHALMITLQEKQIQWHANTHITNIIGNSIVTDIETQKYDLVFDCRGLGANTVFTDLQAVRGEVIWLHAPEVNIQRPIRFMHPRYSLYIAPRPNNIYIIGASEIYANDYSPISVRSTLELLTAVYYLHPAFAEARIIKTMTHCRPAFPNHLPKIKCSNDSIAVNGLYRHGFLIAPTLVDEILRWLENGINTLKYPQIWEFS